jgi:hypothetical protein
MLQTGSEKKFAVFLSHRQRPNMRKSAKGQAKQSDAKREAEIAILKAKVASQ